jgi:hypothetical protein
MLPDYVSIIDMVPASSACRLGRVAQVAPSRARRHRKFQELVIAFCDAVLPDPAYSRTEGELFCIT